MDVDEIKEKLVFFLKAFVFTAILISLLIWFFINPLGMISSIFSFLKVVLIAGGFIWFMKRCNI